MLTTMIIIVMMKMMMVRSLTTDGCTYRFYCTHKQLNETKTPTYMTLPMGVDREKHRIIIKI